MNYLDQFGPQIDRILIYLANVAVAALGVSCFALLAVRLIPQTKLPTRHALLSAASLIALSIPLLVAVADLNKWTFFDVELTEHAGLPSTSAATTRDRYDEVKPAASQAQLRESLQSQPSAEAEIVSPAPIVTNEATTGLSDLESDDEQPDRPLESVQLSADELRPQLVVPSSAANELSDLPTTGDTAPQLENASALHRRNWRYFGLAAAFVWLLGSVLQIVGLARGLRSVRRFVRSTHIVDDPALTRLMHDSAGRFALRRTPQLCASTAAQSPVSIGVLRPRIVLPAASIKAWTTEQWCPLIDHEMAHIARRDHWMGLLERLNLVVYWWNLPYRIVTRKISVLREQICDDLAVYDGQSTRAYADALVDLAGRVVGKPQLRGGLSAVGGRKSELTVRVNRLLSDQPRGETRVGRRGATYVVVVGMLLMAAVVGTTVHTTAAPPEPNRLKKSEEFQADRLGLTQVAPGRSGDNPLDLELPSPLLGRPLTNPLRTQPNVRASMTPVELAKAIAQQKSVAAAERLALSTMEGWEPDVDRGPIYVELAQLCQTWARHPRAIVWAQAALKHPLPNATHVEMYRTWAKSADEINRSLTPSLRDNPSARLNSFLPWTLAALEISHAEDDRISNELNGGVRRGLVYELARRYPGKVSENDRVDFFDRLLKQSAEHDFYRGTLAHDQRAAWPNDDATFSTEFRLDLSETLRFGEQFFNMVVGQPNALQDVLEGFEKDPYGPKISVPDDVFPTLSGRVAVVSRYASPHGPYGESILYGLHATKPVELAKLIKKFVEADANVTTKASSELMQLFVFRDAGKSDFFVAAVDNWLVFSANLQLLKDAVAALQSNASSIPGPIGESESPQPSTQITKQEDPNAVNEPSVVLGGSRASSEEIAHLRELIKSYEQLHEIHKLQVEHGRGSSADLYHVNLHLLLAKANLAEVQGSADEALQFLQDAAEAADRNVESQRTMYDVGQFTMADVLEAEAKRTEIKLLLTRKKQQMGAAE